MLTVGRLAKRFGLSRATILYYEREGLLEPASRAANGYRWYGEDQIQRLGQIMGFRSYGVPVNDIRALLDQDNEQAHEEILRNRFTQLDAEIRELRRQQRDLVAILEHTRSGPGPAMNKDRWTGIMRAAGMNDQDMQNWHCEFESREPEAHQLFLESLNLEQREIERIRTWSRR